MSTSGRHHSLGSPGHGLSHNPPDFPDYEAKGGCVRRGASASWHVYSPLRVRYPYMRGELLEMWQAALKENGDPVKAWESIVNDPQKGPAGPRGHNGFVRFLGTRR